jgi:hypothetical protein
MKTGFGTPLLDLFRRGDVPRDIRLEAARGALEVRTHEGLALLTLLVADDDQEVARAADTTLRGIPATSLAGQLASSDVSEEVRNFFAARGMASAAQDPPEAGAPVAAASGPVEADEEEIDRRSIVQRLASMSVAERLIRAMKGSREERAILVRDPNRLVSTGVLSSPKVTETEIESIAKMANVSEDVLRIIGRTRAWSKSYAVMVALARNPKTPIAMSMNLLPRLTDKDLKLISTDRNVPDVLRTAARRRVVDK